MRTSATLLTLLAPFLLHAQSWHPSLTFGTDGAVLADPTAGSDAGHCHVLRPDGRALLAGEGFDSAPNTYQAVFVQLDTTCGAMDHTFGTGGKAAVTFEQRTRLWNMALQPDGKIVGCGVIAPNNASSQQWPGVFRLNADGSVDSSFNTTGYHRLQFNGGSGAFSNCFVEPDGRIVCTVASPNTGIGAMRFNADGTLDATYGIGGTAVAPITSVNMPARSAGLRRPDGSVIAITTAWSGVDNDYWITLAQFTPTGTLDPDFGTAGVQTGPVVIAATDAMEASVGASLLPDGRILVSATAPGPNLGFLMARYLPDGTPDPAFGTNGVSIVDIGSLCHGARHEVLPDGSTRQYGSLTGGNGMVVARDPDGAPIATFGNNGVVTATAGPAGHRFMNGFTMAGGRMIGYGSFNQVVSVVRLTTDPAGDRPVIGTNGTDLIVTGSGPFQWYLNDAPIPGATSNTITPTENGTYTVEALLSPACTYASEPFEMLNVGVAEEARERFRLIGNVAVDALTVVNNGAGATYMILDAQGRMVASGRLQAGMNTIGTQALASGGYLLRVDAPGMPAQRFVVAGR